MDSSVKCVPLFGEHFSVVLPAEAKDISLIRQVPDNQEVFSHPATDQSLIIEILQYVEEADEQALKTHYEDMAGSNDASNDSEILNAEPIPSETLSMTECSSAYLLTAQQQIAKFNEVAKNKVLIYMVLFRVPEFETDILVTLNDPVDISLSSSSHHDVAVGAQPWTLEQFKQTVCSLSITDTRIFG